MIQCKGRALKRLIEAGLAWLDRNHQWVDALNVFPIPDGDTGINMLLTMRSAFKEIAEDDTNHAGRIAQKVARGALMGARGNSGVILSQIWRGFSREIESLEAFDVRQFAAAMRQASDTAYNGVVKPVEGTILTVIRQASEAAEIAAQSTDDLADAFGQVVSRCRQAVAETPQLLQVLADAGVVDAGGEGLTIILEGMLRFIKGEPLDAALPREFQPLDLEAVGAAMGAVEPGQDWEVVVDFRPRRELELSSFFNRLEMLGTSIQLGQGDDLCRVHIHLPNEKRYEPIEFAETLGTVVNVHMENLLDQVDQQRGGAGAAGPAARLMGQQEIEPGQIASIAVVPGSGIAEAFFSLGVAGVVSGGQTMNPSTEEIVAAIEALETDKVVVLPNNKNIVMAARTACEMCSKQARVVPTLNVPQGVSALLVLEPDGDLDAVSEAMEAAAGEVSAGEITTATRQVELKGVKVRKGDILGLADGKIWCSGPEVAPVVKETLEGMGARDRELLTLYYGVDTTAQEAGDMADRIQEWYPHVEIEVIYGGQPHYFYIMSAE
jgi:DAK2 domain fusion protein YloV